MAWSINPHMQVGAVDRRKAVVQHQTFVRALEGAGANIVAVPFVHGAFDSVFMKDNSVVVERSNGEREALLAVPRYDERRREQRARAEALRRLGIRPVTTSIHRLEGGDVVVAPNARGAFLGHGFRSAAQAAPDLERFFRCEVISLRLRDPRLYHLDMVLTLLDDGTALVCEEALTRASFAAIARSSLVREIVRVPLTEALEFGTNLVQVGRTLVSGANAPRTRAALRSRGYEVIATPLDQFHLAGGSAACLVSRVHAQDRDVRRFAA